MSLTTIADIRAANARTGGHFFDRATMRAFRSRVESEPIGGRYFITSEAKPVGSGRMFSLREFDAEGHVWTVADGWQAFASRRAARAFAYLLIDNASQEDAS